ncbi:GNAT family N-acetyltransferase, partial [Bacillus velezensis]
MLTGRDFEEEDLGFLEQLAAAHPVWKNEEFGTKNAAEFMLAYSM